MSLNKPPSPSGSPPNRLVGIYIGLLLITFCLFILSVSFVVWQDVKNAEDEFQKYTHTVHQGLSQNFAVKETILDGFAAFLADVGVQDPNRARSYTRTMLQRYPHLYMFQAAQRVESNDVIEFERQMSAQSKQLIKVKEFVFGKGLLPVDVLVQSSYYPVVFVEPVFRDGVDILGLDISSIEFVEKAMHQALATGMTSISEVLELSDGSESFVMIKPSMLPGQTVPDQYALIIVKTNVLIQEHIPTEAGYELSIQYADNLPLINMFTENMTSLESNLFPKFESNKYITIGQDKISIKISKQLGFKQNSIVMILIIVLVVIVIYVAVYKYMKMHFESERIKNKAEQKLYQQANYDQLTGLANRHYFEDYFSRILLSHKRQVKKLALLYIDLNDFKEVNDNLGHHVGDALLQEASVIISQAIRGDDLASRFGGDEFVVLLDQVGNEQDVKRVINRLTEVFSNVEFIDHYKIKLSASVGYAIYPDNGETFESMLKVADKNMYKHKRAQKNNNVIPMNKD